MFESTEQRICDQARAIRKNGWLLELELEMIKRGIDEGVMVENEVVEEVAENDRENLRNVDSIEDVENEELVEEQNLGNVLVVDDDVLGELTEEQREITERLKRIIEEKKTADGIFFRNIDKNRITAQITKSFIT